MATERTIGSLIEGEVRRQQISIGEFANRIDCERNNVYNIFKRNNMDILLLKRISKVLNRNFFKELSDDMELIDIQEETENDRMEQRAVSQFFNVVPDVLRELGKYSTIVFSRQDDPEYEDCPVPDFGLPDYYITFTIGETLKERMGECVLLPIEVVSDEEGRTVEVCTNVVYGSVAINIKLDYKTPDEWYRVLAFAFEVCSRLGKE